MPIGKQSYAPKDPIANRVAIAFSEFKGGIRAFAEQLGVTHSSVHQVLSGKNPPGKEMIFALIYVLGYSEKWVLKGEGRKRVANEKPGAALIDIKQFMIKQSIQDNTIAILQQRLEYAFKEIEHLKSRL